MKIITMEDCDNVLKNKSKEELEKTFAKIQEVLVVLKKFGTPGEGLSVLISTMLYMISFIETENPQNYLDEIFLNMKQALKIIMERIEKKDN